MIYGSFLIVIVAMTGCSDSKFDEEEAFEALDSWAIKLEMEERQLTAVEETVLLTWMSSGFMDGEGPMALVEAHPDRIAEIAKSYERIGFDTVAESLVGLLSAWNEADGSEPQVDSDLIDEAETIWFEKHSPRYLKAIYSFVDRNGGFPSR